MYLGEASPWTAASPLNCDLYHAIPLGQLCSMAKKSSSFSLAIATWGVQPELVMQAGSAALLGTYDDRVGQSPWMRPHANVPQPCFPIQQPGITQEPIQSSVRRPM